jgi:hypothetical protein
VILKALETAVFSGAASFAQEIGQQQVKVGATVTDGDARRELYFER